MFKKKKSTDNTDIDIGDSPIFDVTRDQLKSLMELSRKDLIDRLNSEEFHGLEGLLEKLKVDCNKGLDSTNEQDIEQRRIIYGKNEIPPKPIKSFLRLCWESLHDVILIILIVCAIISIGLSFYKPPKTNPEDDEPNLEWIEGIAILFAVVVVVLATSFNNWRKERQFRGLQNKIENDQQASVIRDNHIQQIPVAELVVGDLCFIKYGDVVPADGIIIQASDLKTDESTFTGETNLIKKLPNEDIRLLSGTHVMEGSGRIIITGVGLNTQVGNIMNLLGVTDNENEPKTKKKSKKIKKKKSNLSRQNTNIEEESLPQITTRNQSISNNNENENINERFSKNTLAAIQLEEITEKEDEKSTGKQKSILQAKLTTLALYLGYAGMAGAVLTLISLILRFSITNYVIKKHKATADDVQYFISFLIQSVTVVVVLVPEGLPLAVTLALTYAVRKMMSDNNLVRHLDACETMGNATTICSDKTGTLTTNRMTVVQCFIHGKFNEKLPEKYEINQEILPLLFQSISVNTNYTSKIEGPKNDGGLSIQIGNKTECALLDLVEKWGGSYEQIRKNNPEEKLVKVYTFNSERKMMGTIIKCDDNNYQLYIKGASEIVLAKCKSIINEDNQIKELNEHEKNHIIHNIIENMANNALRTICIAYKDLGTDEQNWDNENEIINDLICISLVGIEDPVRMEVPEAIEKCQRAGVVVRMVTGDNIMTARSIALKCGILKPNDDFLVLDGEEFNRRIRDTSGKISQKKLDEIWPKLRVLARSSPQDKYNLVNGIVQSRATQHQEVVAVTGDGTNDGPALKRADVGFAMGIQGTDVAKQASDIIVTDDNFSSIVTAVIWGRNVYDCIAKFLQFQTTANLAAGSITVVSAVAISSVPFKAIQMLWINLVMDTLASLALATEPPTVELLNRKPYGRTKFIISPIMFRYIIGQSIYQLAVTLIILYVGQLFLDVESAVEKIQHDPKAMKEPSAHFTIVFNTFVLMTLFNEINARKLHGERNIFKGFFSNIYFHIIWLFCFGAQILIVTFGGRVFGCTPLSIKQWAWCLLFGVGSLFWQQVILCIPTKPFGQCFSAMYRICCPWCYKRRARKHAEEEDNRLRSFSIDQRRRVSRLDSYVYIDDDTFDDSKTVTTNPLPTLAALVLRRSFVQLDTELRTIQEFRTRLEEVQDKRQAEINEQRENSESDVSET